MKKAPGMHLSSPSTCRHRHHALASHWVDIVMCIVCPLLLYLVLLLAGASRIQIQIPNPVDLSSTLQIKPGVLSWG